MASADAMSDGGIVHFGTTSNRCCLDWSQCNWGPLLSSQQEGHGSCQILG
jgi:hypothetical protein